MPYRNHEVHLQALLVTEVIEFSPPAGVDLRFDNLGGKEALEQDTEKRGLGKFGIGLDTQEVTGQSGIGQVDLWRLDQPLPQILKVTRSWMALMARTSRSR